MRALRKGTNDLKIGMEESEFIDVTHNWARAIALAIKLSPER
jgi:hypothetical protein